MSINFLQPIAGRLRDFRVLCTPEGFFKNSTLSAAKSRNG